MIAAPAIADFRYSRRSFLGVTRTVYTTGDRGPGVVLTHEIPGMTPEVLRLGKLIAQRGYRVALPSLFGKDGESLSKVRAALMLTRMCVNAEFAVFAANGSSPVIDWLRELCKDFARETGGSVAAIGLCITGGFALSLKVNTDGLVKVTVMAEPSLPFPVPFTSNSAAMHLSPAEQDAVRQTPAACMALRFTGDVLCKRERFDAYQTLLGTNLIRIEIDSPDRAHNLGATAHAVLTQELHDSPGHPTWAAFERVMAFLSANLR
jgi:dienelactone hydrolase